MSIKVIGKMENLMEKASIMKKKQAIFKKVYGKMDSLRVNFLMDVQRNSKLCLRTKNTTLTSLSFYDSLKKHEKLNNIFSKS